MGNVEELDVDEDEDIVGLREIYNSLLKEVRGICKSGQGSCEKDEES